MTSRPDTIHAPFTVEQVSALNEYQDRGNFHPFTCGPCRDVLGTRYDERKLIATIDGWVCATCDTTQDWAWALMASGELTR